MPAEACRNRLVRIVWEIRGEAAHTVLNLSKDTVGAAGDVRVLRADASSMNRARALTGPLDLGLKYAQISRIGIQVPAPAIL